jgi:DNA-binding NtrC family response regulator
MMATVPITGERAWQVLVVDDDDDVRDGLSIWLTREGFHVEVASDGLEALGRLANDGIDAIVCDLDMPRLQGMDLLRHVRNTGMDVVVVILSGRFDLLAQAKDIGEVYACAKPCAPERLLHTLQQALEARN